MLFWFTRKRREIQSFCHAPQRIQEATINVLGFVSWQEISSGTRLKTWRGLDEWTVVCQIWAKLEENCRFLNLCWLFLTKIIALLLVEKHNLTLSHFYLHLSSTCIATQGGADSPFFRVCIQLLLSYKERIGLIRFLFLNERSAQTLFKQLSMTTSGP